MKISRWWLWIGMSVGGLAADYTSPHGIDHGSVNSILDMGWALGLHWFITERWDQVRGWLHRVTG